MTKLGDNNDTTNCEPPRVADIPKFRELAAKVGLVRTFAKWAPRVAPFANLFGVDLRDAVKAARDVGHLAPQLTEQIHLPDRFNVLYARRGWIAYSLMNQQAMLDAITAGERGDLDVGEQLLVDQYNVQFLEFNLNRITCLNNFRDRRELARLSMLDFIDGRFHACVPNVLMLIDGLASDVAGRSFFSEKSDPTSWNSVVGHHTALPALANLLNTRRMIRRTDELTIPYRHGILHGRDLGFANRIVAAKCWGALFAVGEWAQDIEQGRKHAPPPKPRMSFSEWVRDLSRQSKEVDRLKQWCPRKLRPGFDLPISGAPANYEAGTPERVLVEYLVLWRQKNFGDMAKLVAIGRERVDPRTRAGEVSRAYRSHRLEGFELTDLAERGPNVCDINVRCSIDGGRTAELNFQVVREDDETGDWLYTSFDRGSWRVQNWKFAVLELSELSADP